MKDLLDKYLTEEKTDPREVKELVGDLESKTRLQFSDPVPFRNNSIVKFSRMSSRLPSDALAFDNDRVAVVVSGDHAYVIDDDSDDDIKGPFAIYDVDRMASAILDFDRKK